MNWRKPWKVDSHQLRLDLLEKVKGKPTDERIEYSPETHAKCNAK